MLSKCFFSIVTAGFRMFASSIHSVLVGLFFPEMVHRGFFLLTIVFVYFSQYRMPASHRSLYNLFEPAWICLMFLFFCHLLWLSWGTEFQGIPMTRRRRLGILPAGLKSQDIRNSLLDIFRISTLHIWPSDDSSFSHRRNGLKFGATPTSAFIGLTW